MEQRNHLIDALGNFVCIDDPRPKIQSTRLGMLQGIPDQLQQVPVSQQAAMAARLEQSFGYGIRVIDVGDAPAGVQRKFSGGQTSVDTGSLKRTVAYYALPNDRVVRVGPLPFDTMPVVRMFVITLAIGFAIAGLVTWFLVGPVVRGLRNLSNASVRLSAGDFDARVEEDDARALGQVPSAFNHMANRIQELLKSQRHVLQAVSHEFRTPAARIRFELDLLENADSPAGRRERAQRIEDSLDELDSLVGELLEYTRFTDGAPALHLEALNVADELSELERRTSRPDRICLQVDCSTELSVSASPRHFRRAIDNLTRNAIRHAESRVRVSAQATGADLVITVEDDGPGIPVQHRANVFQPFVRLDESRQRESGGAGLGLAVVSRIVAWHGGTVSVDDSPEGGARFTVRFPHGEPSV